VIAISSWCSDRLLSRGPFIGISSVVGAIGYLWVPFETCDRLTSTLDADPRLRRDDIIVLYRLLLTIAHNNHVRYFATFCIVSGTYTTIGLVIAWCKRPPVARSRSLSADERVYLDAHNLGSETKRATGTPLYMAIGQCGSILGSHLFPSIEGPRYM
jgi:MFS transporter, ACS family, DAL5 transporter family protein